MDKQLNIASAVGTCWGFLFNIVNLGNFNTVNYFEASMLTAMNTAIAFVLTLILKNFFSRFTKDKPETTIKPDKADKDKTDNTDGK